MDIVTLSTDTNDCDLRHQCISEFDLHLCTWAQCCSGNGHNFFGTYSTLLYGQFHSYIFLWPIPALTFGVTYSTDASGPNSKLNFVTYSSSPSRPYSVPPFWLVGFAMEKSWFPENFSSPWQLCVVWGLYEPKSPKTTSSRVIIRFLIYSQSNARNSKKNFRFRAAFTKPVNMAGVPLRIFFYDAP